MPDAAVPHPRPARTALTAAQIDIWMHQCLHIRSTHFCISHFYEIPVPFDIPRFIAAANWVFAHYQALYACLQQEPEGTPSLVFDSAKAARCTYVDVSAEADPEKALKAALDGAAHHPFELLDTCLSRHLLVRVSATRATYFCCHHHIIMDGWNVGGVFSRIISAYVALATDGQPAIISPDYGDFLANPPPPLEGPALQRAIEFWKPLLASPVAPLPVCHATEQGDDELSAAFVEVMLPRALIDKLSAEAATCNATIYHVLLLALGYLIGRQFSLEQSNITFPILNRNRDHKETLGMFSESRTLPLQIGGDATIADSLQALSRRIRELYRHYRLSSSEITRLYQEAGNVGSPANHCTVSYLAHQTGSEIEGCSVGWRHYPMRHIQTPLTFYIVDVDQKADVCCELVHQLRHFSVEEAGLLLRRLPLLLEGMASGFTGRRMDELPLLPAQERARIVTMLDRSAEALPSPRPVIHDIVAHAQAHPTLRAVEEAGRHTSYGELIQRAWGMARHLSQNQGVQPGDRVALFLPRGADLIASQLAIMLTGATFVPLDLGTPAFRARQICEDAEIRSLVCNAALAEKAHGIHARLVITEELAPDTSPFTPRTEPSQIAYIIYTSGSTGKPKGVLVSQRALAEHLASWFMVYALRENCERNLLFHSPAFDASIEGVFPFLMRGSTIIAAPHPQWTIYEIPRVLVESRLTIAYFPPAYLLELLKHLRDNPEEIAGHVLGMCLIGGETMHAETGMLWNTVFGPSSKLYNVYGPTETVVTATACKVPSNYHPVPGDSVPIGKPHPGRIFRIVAENGEDVPIGMEGELLIGGIGLGDGYNALPVETADHFVIQTDGRQYYRSGDIVTLRTDGNLVFRRRRDSQIKVRGFRIELGEIESTLLSCPSVRECAVLAFPDAGGMGHELCAFVALKDDPVQSRKLVLDFLKTRLPAYMIPPMVVLPTLPKDANDKIARKELRALKPTEAMQPVAKLALTHPPTGPVQEYLALLWSEVVGREVQDVQVDFFEIGGHSLSAAKLIATMGKAFHVEIPFSVFFEKPTIEHVAQKLADLIGDRGKLEKMAKLRLELSRLSPEEVKTRLENTRRAIPARN